jgi:hypothetical protein
MSWYGIWDVAVLEDEREPIGNACLGPPAELMKLAGYWRDIRESRSEGRRLLVDGD